MMKFVFARYSAPSARATPREALPTMIRPMVAVNTSRFVRFNIPVWAPLVPLPWFATRLLLVLLITSLPPAPVMAALTTAFPPRSVREPAISPPVSVSVWPAPICVV